MAFKWWINDRLINLKCGCVRYKKSLTKSNFLFNNDYFFESNKKNEIIYKDIENVQKTKAEIKQIKLYQLRYSNLNCFCN